MRTFPALDLTPPALPPRSRLYHLPPIGLGTPAVEGLSSYMLRLSAAHSLAGAALIERVLAPHTPPRGQRSPEAMVRLLTHGDYQVNGIGQAADGWIAALERLTLRDDLRFLTLRPWATVLPARGLLRLRRAWCPACLEEWRREGRELHEPLLWGLQLLPGCPRHGRRLASTCPAPACGASQRWVAQRGAIGYCGRCRGWLGEGARGWPAGDGDAERLSAEELAASAEVWRLVGELLARAPRMGEPPGRECVAEAIDASARLDAVGDGSALARLLGVHKTNVWDWRNAKTLPRLAALVRVCGALDVSLWSLLMEGGAQRAAAHAPGGPAAAAGAGTRRTRRKVEWRAATAALQEAVSANAAALAAGGDGAGTPATLRLLEGRLDIDRRLLRTHAPELCRTIAAQCHEFHRRARDRAVRARCAEATRICELLVARGVYPSTARLAKALEKPGIMRDPAVRAAVRAFRRQLGAPGGAAPLPGEQTDEG